MKFSDVAAEIRAVVESLKSDNKRDLTVLSLRVLNNHPHVNGTDVEFHKCCALVAIRHEIRQQLNSIRATDDDEAQMPLEFVHLQASYAIERNGSDQHVALADATNDELLLKSQQYRTMGSALYAHADELLRYVAVRSAGGPTIAPPKRPTSKTKRSRA